MDQYHSQLAHHILELAPQLDLPVLLVIDAPFPTFVLPQEPYSVVTFPRFDGHQVTRLRPSRRSVED